MIQPQYPNSEILVGAQTTDSFDGRSSISLTNCCRKLRLDGMIGQEYCIFDNTTSNQAAARPHLGDLLDSSYDVCCLYITSTTKMQMFRYDESCLGSMMSRQYPLKVVGRRVYKEVPSEAWIEFIITLT
jgi:hypothetical protein